MTHVHFHEVKSQTNRKRSLTRENKLQLMHFNNQDISKEKYYLLSLNAITSDVDRDHIRYLRIPRATNHNLFYDIN